jgi:hypothetical protein
MAEVVKETRIEFPEGAVYISGSIGDTYSIKVIGAGYASNTVLLAEYEYDTKEEWIESYNHLSTELQLIAKYQGDQAIMELLDNHR